MIKLMNLNVVKLVEEEVQAQALERKGFKRIESESVDQGSGFNLDKPLDDMTVPELKAYAKLHEIDLGEAKKKDDILDVVLGFKPNTGAGPDAAES